MNSKEFLKKLKSGDTVIVHTSHLFYKSDRVTTVQKITPKGFIKVNDVLYNPDTGVARGDWDQMLLEATPAAVQEIKERVYVKNAIEKIHNINKLTYKQAVDIMAIIEPEAAE